MSDPIRFAENSATEAQIAEHLLCCDADFVPRLSTRTPIAVYAQRIAGNAMRFEAWAGAALVGLVALYANDAQRRTAFVTNVSVLKQWRGRRIASQLLDRCLDHVKALGFERVELEVHGDHAAAIGMYRKKGFAGKPGEGSMVLRIDTEKDKTMAVQRDYNVEIKDTADHQYAYSFDFDVMHPYMLRSFEPFFKPGNILELGSFQGDFTKRLLPRFADVTCVEASDVAIEAARSKLGDRVKFINATFETAQLPQRYDNIVLTHVLEHLDDPVRVLKRINQEWLAEGGRLFLVCPNANAASRQIAVKMGLITHNAAVTPAEAAHGHRCTYSLATLEQDATAAGLKVLHRSGIFFKALANFQWDRLLQTDIISKEYLDGCYLLGEEHPDLCSSIFLMCESGAGAPVKTASGE
jgi:2-polyprenyl-3-methyl-5-hydroxy-6-metoxy-1,4-benzoquinol methylase/GNAT superfamily N-acetyltransferase